MQRHTATLLALLLLVAPCAAGTRVHAQAAARADAQPAAAGPLVVDGDVANTLSLTPADIRNLPRTQVKVEQDDRTVVYDGVLVGELLKRAGVPLGSDLRGDAVATYVVAHAADGYRAIFGLAELDPGFTSNDILVADTVDGKPLFDYQGPLRIVAPKDLRGARSVRMLQRLQVVRVAP